MELTPSKARWRVRVALAFTCAAWCVACASTSPKQARPEELAPKARTFPTNSARLTSPRLTPTPRQAETAPLQTESSSPSASTIAPFTREERRNQQPPVPCGNLNCLAFATAEDALGYVIDQTAPLVLGVGEIHAQKDSKVKTTTAHRFTLLLPLFKAQARHLLIELWTARNDCGDDRVNRVREAQRPVTQAQSDANQTDYLQLGSKAKELGIAPHALVPTCEELRAIVEAQSNDIAEMLRLTARKTNYEVNRLLANAAQENPRGGPYVVTYGGALHNDLQPRPGRENWSFGPALDDATNHRFVELDLVQREQVRDSENFRSFPWYDEFRACQTNERFLLYRTAKSSFVLIFPETSEAR